MGNSGKKVGKIKSIIGSGLASGVHIRQTTGIIKYSST